MIRSQAPRRALAAHLLLASVSLAGCSFPTSEFTLDAAATRVDAPDVGPPDVPAFDVPVVDAPDVTTLDADLDAAADATADASDATGDATPCPTGQTTCGGACADTETSALHCGRCDNRCEAANATGVCAASTCTFTCNPGYADCNGDAADGCEANLATAATCGSCMTRCDATNGTAACTAGACTVACNVGYGNCDGNAANGCEANLLSDPARCGSCTTACANTNGMPTCTAGACGITCSPGYGNCDLNAANGCEVNLNTDRAYCGACTASACTGTQSCVAGACTTVCPTPTTICPTGCADLATSATNCGACGRACAAPNGTPRCTAGACGIASCNVGYADCDTTAPGCETSTAANLLNCGACGNRCAFANAAATCAAGACVLGACNAGFANCDGIAANGCEANLQTDTANCGACSTRCAPPNAAAVCTAGACGIGRCLAGFANCDTNAANGCEINTASDVANCGTCGNACTPPSIYFTGSAACSASACTVACNAGYANCDGNLANGCEASTGTNAHCGRCTSTCALTCGAAGACAGTAPGSYRGLLFTFPPPAFIDACSAAGHVNYLPNLDDGSVRVALPFAMRFWNTTLAAATMVNITSNGWLSLDGVARQDYVGILPDPAAPNSVVAPYFTDLYTSATGVCVATIGVAPSRRFVVEWFDAVFLSDRTRHLTFETILNESGTIEFYYGAMAAPPTNQNINVGIENPTGVAGVTVCASGTACGVATNGRYAYAPL